jgi:hypothetical protein
MMGPDECNPFPAKSEWRREKKRKQSLLIQNSCDAKGALRLD